MVRLRLFRTGTKKRPMYRIVAVDQRAQRQGRVLEILGTYQPRLENQVTLSLESVDKWLSKGAQPSDTVKNIVDRYRRAAPASGDSAQA